MRQYAVIANLETVRGKHFSLSSLPLHVTILSIFFSVERPSFFSKVLKNAAAETRTVTVKTIGRALYGVNRNVPVTLVDRSHELKKLHLKLLDEVSEKVSFQAPQFTGENYGPHVTDQEDRSIPVGIDLSVDNLSLVEIVEPDVVIRSVHHLAIAITPT